MSELFHVEPDGIDRRSFVRRLFAIGAGIAVSGELIRRVELIVPPEPQMSGRALLTLYEQGRIPVTLADWDALLHEDYVRAHIVEAYSLETPFLGKLRAAKRPFAGGKYIGVELRG